MGGLVARSFIVNYGPQFPYVKLFISLATPWGGDRMAEYGVKQVSGGHSELDRYATRK